MNKHAKSVSKKQQRLFGMVHAVQQGELPPYKVSPKIREMAKEIKPADVVDMASTKHDKLAAVFAKIASVYIMDIEERFPQPLKSNARKYLTKVLPKYNKKTDRIIKNRKWYQIRSTVRDREDSKIRNILTDNILQKYPETQQGYMRKEEIDQIKNQFGYPFSEKQINFLIKLFPKLTLDYNEKNIIDKLVTRFPELVASKEVSRLRAERNRLQEKQYPLREQTGFPEKQD